MPDARRSQGVEASIAATVAITALADLLPPTRWHGWPLAFAFGLVHGFRFAGALAELIRGEIHRRVFANNPLSGAASLDAISRSKYALYSVLINI